MDIKEYVNCGKKFTLSQMAKDLQCSYSHLHHIMTRTQRASYNMAKKIEEYTKGKVKLKEIMEWELKPKKKNQDDSSNNI